MSEDELDNFFAKKDKSKKKNKKNKTTISIQQLQETDNNELVEDEVKKPKKKTNKPDSDSIEKILGINDNDWQEHNIDDVDYSTLRVQNLSVGGTRLGEEGHDMVSNSENDDDDILDSHHDKQKESGPWKENHYKPVQINIEQAEPEPVAKVIAEPVICTNGPKRYVPPSKRMTGGGMASSSGPLRRHQRNCKPNMNSESDFPSLAPGVACPNSSGGSTGSFTKVKDGAKNDYSQEVANKVSIDNKFKALSN